ncbi:MAG: hypothetical protein HOL04_08960 [Gammaproteobacteria bacterium]|jgi:vacuolar-type H+-ATPase subunit B/Vma2|nr:hypothetical protein [Gammaproteobacteria bacterium]MBT4605656.1 hypothetical protein [Thiotrichales bacterium]MBT3473448.1 hypothetical protein [Gammaproteobacteria bacterium]MBT3968070.1 hypothetical protein [Gammaproteobacteria bacterium]MBT4079895.1 hypothetical protein [Gammaproteobacteria bacterium]
MGKSVRKRFAHQIPVEQLHQRLLSLAESEAGSDSSGEGVRFERSGDGYKILGNYSGFSVNGNVTLSEHELSIEIELPMLARMFQGKVEHYIEEQAKQLLH